MKLRAVSGLGVKGPACFLLEIGGLRLLLDCGRGPDLDAPPDLSGVGKVDAVLVSHAHRDHTGALDLVGPVGGPSIYASELTGRLAGFTPDVILPLGGSVEVGGVEILTGRAGHAPGGLWLRVGGEAGLLYTGDFSSEGALFRPEPRPRARALLFDASYGSYDGDLAQGLAAIELVARNGPVLLPTPAAGRGLEMAVELQRSGHEVRLCPVHRAVAAQTLELDPGLDADARLALAGLLADTRELDAAAAPSGVMIAARADASGGLAGRLVSQWTRRPEVAVVFTGHLAAGTPAKDLVAASRAQFIRWNVHPRLRDMRQLLAEVAPQAAMPAFLPAERLPLLAEALSGAPLVLAPDMELSRR